MESTDNYLIGKFTSLAADDIVSIRPMNIEYQLLVYLIIS